MLAPGIHSLQSVVDRGAFSIISPKSESLEWKTSGIGNCNDHYHHQLCQGNPALLLLLLICGQSSLWAFDVICWPGMRSNWLDRLGGDHPPGQTVRFGSVAAADWSCNSLALCNNLHSSRDVCLAWLWSNRVVIILIIIKYYVAVTLKCTIYHRFCGLSFADGNFEAAERNYSTSGTLFIARAPATSGHSSGPSETNHNDRVERGDRTAEAGPAATPATDARTTVAGTCGRTTDAAGHATSEPCARSRSSSCSSGRSRSRCWTTGPGQSTARPSVGVEAGPASTRGDEEQQRNERVGPGQTCKLIGDFGWHWMLYLKRSC